jgi:large repetitive protein
VASFNYNINLTGDCQNNGSGAIQVGFSGGTPPYTIAWAQPIGVTDVLIYDFDPLTPTTGYETYSFVDGLSAATYSFRVNDSTVPTNLEYDVNVPVSSGNCTSILDVSATTCNTDSGSVTADASSDFSETGYFLYTSNNELLQSGLTGLGLFTFQNLSAGTYFVTSVDYGGCSGTSSTFIVNNSVVVDFGFYPVDDTQCGQASGKIIVTGQTGVQPFTYQWNDGSTGSTLSGLTAGTYSVKVTDATGCFTIKEQSIGQIDPVGLGAFTIDTIPTCLNTDGVLTMTITGGTGPYYYSASTGAIDVSYSQSFTLNGIPAGSYNFSVTDAALCKFTTGVDVATENGISDIILEVNPSFCSNADGSILVTALGGTSPFTYTLIYPDSSTFSITSNAASYTFSELSGGTYTVILEDSSGCYFLSESAILSQNSFTITASTTGTTCAANNATIVVEKSVGGTSPFDYSLDGIQNVIDTTASAVTFSNVSAGQHTISVTDASGCTQTQQVFITPSTPLVYNLYSTSCGQGSEGTITAFISDGIPPFTYDWSDNVDSNPQQIKVTGLTAGTYSLTVLDSSGCSQTRTTIIDCDKTYVSYQSYVMGAEQFNLVSPTKRGILQMLNEGFDDLTTGNTNCDLVTTEFYAKVQVQPIGIVLEELFFTGTSLIQPPSDSLWYSTIESMLESIYGIGNVTVNQLTNEITIETDRSETSLNGQEVIIELIIVYDIMCLT